MTKIANLPKKDYTWDLVVNGETKMNGTITRVISAKGFGFIRGKNEPTEYFFHRQDCVKNDFDEISYSVDMGQVIDVNFDVVPSDRGPRAANVVKV